MKARLVGRRETWKVDRKASTERAMKGTEVECRQSLSIFQRGD
jgi:glucokinase